MSEDSVQMRSMHLSLTETYVLAARSVTVMHESFHLPKGVRVLGAALGITLVFFIIEFIGGIYTRSLALQTDALHMLNDTFALSMALLAAWLAERPTTHNRTYGYYRAEILAAFLNGIALWGVVAFILYEAFQRILNPVEVRSFEMLIIAILGLIANGFAAMVLSGSREVSLNIKGAFLHVVTDILGSIGAISAAAIMFLTGWRQADPLLSILIGGFVLYGSAKLVRESANVLLEGAPSSIDVRALEQRLSRVEGIESVHDLHVWCITPTKMCCMSCHVVVRKDVDRKILMNKLIMILKEEFGIDHTTIQMEDEGYPKSSGEHQ